MTSCNINFIIYIKKKPKQINFSKVTELEEELKVVGNNMKSLEVSEQEVD